MHTTDGISSSLPPQGKRETKKDRETERNRDRETERQRVRDKRRQLKKSPQQKNSDINFHKIHTKHTNYISVPLINKITCINWGMPFHKKN